MGSAPAQNPRKHTHAHAHTRTHAHAHTHTHTHTHTGNRIPRAGATVVLTFDPVTLSWFPLKVSSGHLWKPSVKCLQCFLEPPPWTQRLVHHSSHRQHRGWRHSSLRPPHLWSFKKKKHLRRHITECVLDTIYIWLDYFTDSFAWGKSWRNNCIWAFKWAPNQIWTGCGWLLFLFPKHLLWICVF